MVEGLEVVINYSGEKYNKVASPATSSAEFSILKKDLAHLRVHSPSQRNVRRVNGSFILHWPTAGTSPHVKGLTDSLHMRWFKLCSDDPEACKLRELLSIGRLIGSTNSLQKASQHTSPGTLAERLVQQPVHVPLPSLSTPVKPQLPPTPKVPPSAPRSDRLQQPQLKRRLSGPSNPAVTRQKLDTSEMQTVTALHISNTQPQPTNVSTFPIEDGRSGPSTPRGATKTVPQVAQHDGTPTHIQPSSPRREPGEVSPQKPSTPITLAVSSPSNLASGPQPSPLHHITPSSPRPSPASPGNEYDSQVPHQRNRDVNRLMRELWDMRRQLAAMQTREQLILDDLERLGTRPDSSNTDRVSREELSRLEAELRTEKARRVRAEQALNDVEKECRAPFVVPALFQAFMTISELSN